MILKSTFFKVTITVRTPEGFCLSKLKTCFLPWSRSNYNLIVTSPMVFAGT